MVVINHLSYGTCRAQHPEVLEAARVPQGPPGRRAQQQSPQAHGLGRSRSSDVEPRVGDGQPELIFREVFLRDFNRHLLRKGEATYIHPLKAPIKGEAPLVVCQ